MLKPQRGRSGSRLYRLEDLERLEQIAALKFLGIPASEIKQLLKHGPLTLVDSLHVQREALAEKRKMIGRAIVAIEAAENVTQSGQTTDASILRKIIEVIDMQPQEKFMRKYYSDQAWLDRKCIVDQTPVEARKKNLLAWRQLFTEIEAATDLDPASASAQALAKRWLQIVETADGGNEGVRAGGIEAWKDRDNWPQEQQDKASGKLRSRSTRQDRFHAACRCSNKIHRADNWPQVCNRIFDPSTALIRLNRKLLFSFKTMLGEDRIQHCTLGGLAVAVAPSQPVWVPAARTCRQRAAAAVRTHWMQGFPERWPTVGNGVSV